MTLVERVYRLRRLAGICESDGLNMDEVEELSSLEAEFALGRGNRRFARVPVTGSALVRRAGRTDEVELVDIAPGGAACRGLPRVREGEELELSLHAADARLTHRFAARVAWVEQDEDGNRVGLCFVGTPIEVRHGEPRRARPITEPVVEIAA